MELKKGTLLFLLLTCLAYTTLAQTDYTLQGSDVTIDDGIITGCKDAFSKTSIIIPKKIGDITITGIGKDAFKDKNLVAVAFAAESEVKTIGTSAFQRNQLTTLSLPTTLTTIESWAFQNNQITTLTFPDDAQLTTIGGYAFLQNKITTLDLPEGLTTIEFSAFENNQITELSLPTTLITIGEWAFYQNQITEPTLPTALTTIGEYAFRDNRITSLTFPENSQLTTIGKEAFLGNEDDGGNQITELTLPTALTTIGESAFGNNKITTLTFPENAQLTTIGKEAFRGNNLTSVTFRDVSNLEYIRLQAFADNPNLAPIKFPSHARNDFEDYRDGNENHYNPGDTFSDFSLAYFAYIPYELTANELTVDANGVITDCDCDNLPSKTIIIPTSITGREITGIAYGVFRYEGIISVSFPADSKVTFIGELAFQATILAFVDFPAGLTTIGSDAFSGGNNLTSLDFPAGLTTIGNAAFFGNQLESFTLPMATKEGFRTYWEDGDSKDLGASPTINQADFGKSFELVSIEQVTLTVEVNNEEGGSIEPSDDHFAIDKADAPSTQKLTAKPNPGWRFDKWVIGGEDENGNPITETVDVDVVEVTVDADKTATAHFVKQVTLTLTIKETEALGEVSGLNAGENKIDKGADFELKAMPASGQRFASWTIDGKTTIVTEEYTLPATDTEDDISITVTFEAIPQQVTLTLAIEGEGSINPLVKPNSVDPDNEMKGLYDIDTEVTLEATSNEGWRFDKWVISDEENKTDKTTTITLDTDKTTTAHFVQLVTLTTSVEGQQGGTISTTPKPSLEDNQYDINTEVELTATPNEGWKFDKWEISDEENKTDEVTTITLNQDKTVTAHFVKEEEAITNILTEVVSATPYPNPVTSQITLKAKDGDLIQLFSQKGEQQYSTQHTGNEVHTIDVTTIPVGMYLVRITDAEGNTTTKRIVKK